MPIQGPKVKVSRSLGIALTPKAVKILEKRNFPPGQHGIGRKRSASIYKTQMTEKQRLKFTYNISESHLRKAYRVAAHQAGATGANLLIMLERRFDAAVLRMGFARTTSAARQYCAHGHFELNGKRVFAGSQLVKVGDVISVREKSKNHPQIVEASKGGPVVPPYYEVDVAKLEGKVIAIPMRDQIPVQLQEQLVVEFYSR